MIMINLMFIIMAVGVIISGIYFLVTKPLTVMERFVIAVCLVLNGGFAFMMWGMVK